jgi:ATP-dependent DNA ligase
MVFDLLHLDATDYRAQPLTVRRKALEKLIFTRGREGYVAKDPTTPYVGGRTLKWLKVKQVTYRETERGFYKL